MSQSAATAGRPVRRPLPQRPALQLVTPIARTRSNLPFVLLCSFALAAGLIAVLFLNMQLSAGSYEMDRLQKRSYLAADQEAKLREELAAESAAGKLAQRATAQGMVPGTAAMFLSLPDGKILGVAPTEGAKDPLRVVVDGATPAPSGSSGQPKQPGAQASGDASRPASDAAPSTPSARSTSAPSSRASSTPSPRSTPTSTARR